mgnify:CR=1 FL=1
MVEPHQARIVFVDQRRPAVGGDQVLRPQDARMRDAFERLELAIGVLLALLVDGARCARGVRKQPHAPVDVGQALVMGAPVLVQVGFPEQAIKDADAFNKNYGAKKPAEAAQVAPGQRRVDAAGAALHVLQQLAQAARHHGFAATVIRAGDFFGAGSGSWLDQGVMGLATLGYSMPVFWTGILLVILALVKRK